MIPMTIGRCRSPAMLIALLAIFAFALLFIGTRLGWFAAEPVRHGKTVTHWLDRLQLYDLRTNAEGVEIVERPPERVAKDPALEALVAMGPKIVPVLQARIMDRAEWDPAGPSRLSRWFQWLWDGLHGHRFPKPAPEQWSEFQRRRKNAAAYVLLVLGTNAQAGLGPFIEAYTVAPKHESIARTTVPGPPVGVYPHLVIRMASKTHPHRRVELVAEILQAMQHTNSWHRHVALLCAGQFPEQFLTWKKEYFACLNDQDHLVQEQALLSLMMILQAKEKPAAMPITEIENVLSQVADAPQTSARTRDIANTVRTLIDQKRQ